MTDGTPFATGFRFGRTGDLTFRAWDQTTGASGDTGVDVSTNGGTTAYSTDTETAFVTVIERDSDGDGVRDSDDIDDDNDGILDENESETPFVFDLNLITIPAPFTVQTANTPLWFTTTPTYFIGEPDDPNVDNAALDITDHTTGSATEGEIFAINAGGAPPGGQELKVIEFDAPVSENSDYILSLAHMVWSPLFANGGGPLYIDVNGTRIDTIPADAGRTPTFGTWTTDSYTVDSGNSTTMNVVISVRQGPGNGGFDYMLDDVALSPAPGVILGTDGDGDGGFDHIDLDSDNDGIPDNIEAQTTQDYIAPTGVGPLMQDQDGDGLDDAYDQTPNGNPNGDGSIGLIPVDTDSDGDGDYLDTDSDDDGVLDVAEAGHGLDQATIDASGDADFDGLKDAVDDVVGFDVNDTDIDVSGNFLLPDSDNDTAADGSDAVPPTRDLDFRDANAPPVAVDDTLSVNEGDGAVVVDVLGNDTTVEPGDTFAVQSVDTTGTTGTVTLNAGVVEYTPNAPDSLAVGATLTDTFTYTMTDGIAGHAASTATVTVTINGVNDAPVIADLDGESITAPNNGTPVSLDPAPVASITDPDAVTDYDGGTLTVTGTGFDAADALGMGAGVTLSAGFADASTVSVGATVIGTLSGVSASGATVTFNASADLAAVSAVLGSFEFATTGAASGARTVNFVFVDGDGTANGGADTSNTATVTVNVALATTASLSVTTPGAEGGADAVYTVTLDQPNTTGADITFDIARSDGTSDATDYSTTLPGTVTVPNGSATGTFNVAIVDDGLVEGDETLELTISNPSNGGVTFGTAAASATIADNDSAELTIVATTPASEPATNGQFTVNLSQPSVSDTTVSVIFSGTASGADYSAPNSVTIPAGVTSATLDVTVINDGDLEGNETVIATLDSVAGETAISVSATSNNATVTIGDDDTATVSIAVSDADAGESPVNAGEFTINLDQANNTGAPITVSYTVAGSATSGDDYTPLSGTVQIADGDSSAVIALSPADDALFEGTESVELTLTSTDNGSVSVDPTAATASIDIVDDEATTGVLASVSANDADATEGGDAGQFTIALSTVNNTGSDIVVSYDLSGTAESGSDFDPLTGTATIADGQSSVTADLNPRDDGLLESAETVVMTLTGANNASVNVDTTPTTVTIADDETANGIAVSVVASDGGAGEGATGAADDGEFTVQLSAPNATGAPIVVNYSVGGSATPGVDYPALPGTVTIPDGSDNATIVVSPTDDRAAEPDETVVLTVTGTDNGAVTPAAAPADSATVTISDDELAAGVLASIVATDATAAENATPADGAQFTVSLSAANGTGADLEVSYVVAGSATEGDDYGALAGSVSIAAGASSAVIDLATLDDGLLEGDETVQLTLTGTSEPGFDIDGAADTATATISDDESAPGAVTVGVVANQPAAAEGGTPTAGEFTFNLSAPNSTGGDIAVNFTLAGAASAGDYVAAPATVTIPDGESSATLTITPTDDAEFEGTENVVLTVTGASVPSIGVDPSASSASVAIADDEFASGTTVGIAATDATAAESPLDTATFTVTLGEVNNTGAPVTITYNVDGSTADAGDYSALPGSVAIQPGDSSATITVTPIDDGLTEVDERVVVTLTGTDSAGVTVDGAADSAIVTLTSEDIGGISTPNVNNTPDGAELTGTGEPGSTVTLTDGAGDPLLDGIGNPVTTTVGPDGNWSVAGIAPPITDGDTVTATTTDPDGNSSSVTKALNVGTGDTTPPVPPTVNNTPDGDGLTGTAEPGSTITLTGPDGTPLVDTGGNPVTTTADPDGNWSVSDIDPDVTDGQPVTVTSTDPSGNSTSTTATPSVGTGDTTPPVPPTVNNTPDGDGLTGTAEPGSTITLTGPDGTPLVDTGGNPVTTTADPDGNWSVSDIDPDVTDGQPVTVTSTDPSGNSTSTTATPSVGTGDTTPPVGPGINNTPDGTQLTGTGEPGSTITLAGPDGAPLVDSSGNPVTATVDPSGRWTVSDITPPLTDGVPVTATSTDPAGNSSSTTDTTAVGTGDTTPPLPPTVNNTPDGDTIGGTAEPGSTVTLTNPDGTPLVDSTGTPITAIADANGNWSVDDIAPDLTDGQPITVTSTDPSGNSTSTGATPNVGTGDTTPPLPPTVNNTPDGTELTGTGEPGGTVTVTGPDGTPLVDDEGNPITTTVDDDGNWSVDGIDPPLTDGTPITVTVTDPAGNSTSTGATPNVGTGDTTPPLPPGVNNTPNGDELTGTAEPGSTITLIGPDGTPLVDDEGNPVTTTVDDDGNWSVDGIDPPLTDGTPITVTVTDPAGNSTSTGATPSVGTGDTTPPLPPTVNNTPDGTELTGTGEPGGTVTVTGPDGTPLVDDEGNPVTTTVDDDGNWSVDGIDPPLTDGTPITVTVTDPAGNSTSTGATPNVGTGDTTPPLPPGVNNTPNGDELTGTAEPGSTITLIGPDGTPLTDSNGNPLTTVAGPDGNWRITDIDPDLRDGDPVTVRVTDPAGNSTSTTTSPNVGTGDTTPPRTPGGNNTPSGDELTGTGEPGSTITVIDENGNPLVDSNGDPLTATVDDNGNWSITDIDPDLIDGQRITIISTDPAGNSSAGTDVVRVGTGDTTAPADPGIDGSTSATVLTGFGEPGSTIALYDGDGSPLVDSNGSPIAVVVGADGRWQAVDIDPGLNPGDRVVIVSTDAAGNSRSTAATVTVDIDDDIDDDVDDVDVPGDINALIGEPSRPQPRAAADSAGDSVDIAIENDLVLTPALDALGGGVPILATGADATLFVLPTVESFDVRRDAPGAGDVAPITTGSFAAPTAALGDSAAVNLGTSEAGEFTVPAAAGTSDVGVGVVDAALLLNTQFYGGALYLEFEYRPASGSAVFATAYEARLADGGPLPPWLSLDPTSGSMSGVPPVDIEDLELRLLVRLSNGTLIERLVEVNAKTGQIVDIDTVAALGDPGVVPFAEQVAHAASSFDREASKLLAAFS